MGMKYSMEGFIKYLQINKSKRGFKDHNASGKSLILWSVVTMVDDNTVHVSQGTIKLMYI